MAEKKQYEVRIMDSDGVVVRTERVHAADVFEARRLAKSQWGKDTLMWFHNEEDARKPR